MITRSARRVNGRRRPVSGRIAISRIIAILPKTLQRYAKATGARLKITLETKEVRPKRERESQAA